MFKRITNPSQRTISVTLLLLTLTAALFVFAKPAPAVADVDFLTAYTETQFVDNGRSRELNGYIWYPTSATENAQLVDENAVFYGFSAIADGPIADGKYPLIVLSHGSGGNRANQGWLATQLAWQGAIVVAANHPGSTSRDSAPATNILTWNRPADISFVIDSMLADPQYAPYIDSDRIAIVGHSLGGYTALAIGGAELSLDQFIAYCDASPSSPDCQFYRDGGVDLTQVDRTKFEQANRDERVSAVVSIDPAYARSFTEASLASLTDTLLIAAPLEIGTMGDIKASQLADELPEGSEYVEMTGAHHFSFLPNCKSIGYYLLMIVEKGGELLCDSESGTTRDAVHDETTDVVIDFLQRQEILTP